MDRWLARIFDAGAPAGRGSNFAPWTDHEKLVVRRWLAAAVLLSVAGFGGLLAAAHGAAPSAIRLLEGAVTSLLIIIALGLVIAMLRVWKRRRDSH